MRIVELARRAVGCLDVAIYADSVDPGPVNAGDVVAAIGEVNAKPGVSCSCTAAAMRPTYAPVRNAAPPKLQEGERGALHIARYPG